MSKRGRTRFTKQQRREFNNRPHPEEEVESLTPVLDITTWKPVDGVEDFIKNGSMSNMMKHKPLIRFGCRILLSDDEPWGVRKEVDPRFTGGEYPPSNVYKNKNCGRWEE